MSHESAEISGAIKDAGRWVSDSLDEIAGGMWAGSGISELIAALERIAESLERQTGVLEAIAEAVREGKDNE